MAEWHIATRRRMADLDLQLPAVTPALASYVPAKLDPHTNQIEVSGQLPMVNDVLMGTGLVGRDLSFDDAKPMARQVALSILAAIGTVADLDHIEMMRVQALVASAPDFYRQHKLADEASNLLVSILGERGRHARAAVSSQPLPMNAPMEFVALARRIPESTPAGLSPR